MNWNPFARKHVIETTGKTRATENKVFEAYTNMRFGMWVMTPKGVGIIVETNWAQDITIFVDLVGPDGITTENMVPFQLTDLRQAKLKEIPQFRRPNKELAARLGYP